MQVKSIAECFIKLPIVIKIFVLSIFEWLFYTGLTVLHLFVGFVCLFVLLLYIPSEQLWS